MWNRIHFRLSRHILLILSWEWAFLKLNSNSSVSHILHALVDWQGRADASALHTACHNPYRCKTFYRKIYDAFCGSKLLWESRLSYHYVFTLCLIITPLAHSLSYVNKSSGSLWLVNQTDSQHPLSGPDRLATDTAVSGAALILSFFFLNANKTIVQGREMKQQVFFFKYKESCEEGWSHLVGYWRRNQIW